MTLRTNAAVAAGAAMLGLVVATGASAQSLGAFTFQQSPYCNLITVTITQNGSLYTLDGSDDQCGATQRASAVGTAFLNPDGSVGLGLTIVAAPAGVPEHIDAAISAVTGSGTWRDSAGNTGSFLLTSAATGSGNPRPAAAPGIPDGSITTAKLADGAVDSAKILDGSVAAADVNTAEIQRRITSSCPSGELMTGVNVDGTVSCGAPSSSGGGDITGVNAGLGLTGGGASGDVTVAVNTALVQARVTGVCPAGESIRQILAAGTVVCEPDDAGTGTGDITGVTAGLGLSGGGTSGTPTLAVNFGGTGVAFTAARSDHTHAGPGSENTALGEAAVQALGSGAVANTAVGYHALNAAVSNDDNTAVGSRALEVSTGFSNTAVGARALQAASTGGSNVAVGTDTLAALTTGSTNTGAGHGALAALTTGSNNVALGAGAGSALTTGDYNVYLGNAGVTSESNTIRIGDTHQTRAFITGVHLVTTGINNALAVVVDGNGQLGTVSSTRRLKEDIHDLGGVGMKLQQLRPVQFRYIQPMADGSKPVQYGLIAEEVAEVLPELVAYDQDGLPASVMYHVLPTLLVEEAQRLERERLSLTERVQVLEQAVRRTSPQQEHR